MLYIDGLPTLVCGGRSGSIYMWDLNKGKLIFRKEDCHNDKVSTLFSLSDKPYFLSSSLDGSIKASD
jgi:WD40 repeat protein